MPRFSLAARVMEVIADLGDGEHPRYRYGSGCHVAGRTLITAAHVVLGAVNVQVRDTNKNVHEATLDQSFIGGQDGLMPDLALLEIATPAIEVPAIGLAAVDRDNLTGTPLEGCHAIGYPEFMERNEPGIGRVRDTAEAFGHVPLLSGLTGGLLTVQVSSTPRDHPPTQVSLGHSAWSGMSGGPLIVGGCLLGIVTEHAPRAGQSAITLTPLTALEADPAHPGWGSGVAAPGAWWARLGVSGLDELRRMPVQAQSTEPAYLATVREIHDRTELLKARQRELGEIAAFATSSEGIDGWLRTLGQAKRLCSPRPP